MGGMKDIKRGRGFDEFKWEVGEKVVWVFIVGRVRALIDIKVLCCVFVRIVLFSLYNNFVRLLLLLFFFYKWANWGIETLNKVLGGVGW